MNEPIDDPLENDAGANPDICAICGTAIAEGEDFQVGTASQHYHLKCAQIRRDAIRPGRDDD